ncbi:MAG: transcriptional repressor [Clostridia bacterium]|nr:transcriptional repressor [Clostridia bacterium]
MGSRGGYRTRQQEELLAFLRASRGEHLTAADIRDHFSGCDRPIGTTTIYRQLERLVEDGSVRRYLLETGDSACYEYVGADQLNAPHFHCKCERCGRLLHVSCEELSALEAHLLSHHGFAWNSGKTVFYGVCGECRNA